MLSAQIRQMRSFLVIRQPCSDAVGHHHNERAIIHIQPIGTAHQFIVAVSHEWAVNVLAQIGLVKSGHRLFPLEAQDIGDHVVRISTGKYKIGHSGVV